MAYVHFHSKLTLTLRACCWQEQTYALNSMSVFLPQANTNPNLKSLNGQEEGKQRVNEKWGYKTGDGEVFGGDVDGSLAPAGWWGSAGLARVQKVSLWLFICGLAAHQCRPYRHNGHSGEDTTKERTQHIVKRMMSDSVHANEWSLVGSAHAGLHTRASVSFTSHQLVLEAKSMFPFLLVSSGLSSARFHQQWYRTWEGSSVRFQPPGPHCIMSFTLQALCLYIRLSSRPLKVCALNLKRQSHFR